MKDKFDNLVSIILPTFNRSYCIKRAIDSIINQTYNNFELIVVDNNSQDETKTIIQSYKDARIKFIKIDNKGVIAKSRNKGASIAKGRFLAFLDSDDWWLPSKLMVSINHLKSGYDVVYHDLFVVSKYTTRKKMVKISKARPLFSPAFEDLIKNGNDIATSGLVLKKDIFSKVKGFNEERDLIAAEDFHTWIKISKVSEKFFHIPKTLGYLFVGEDNATSFNRTVTNLTYLHKTYIDDIKKICKKTYPNWMAYSFARAYYGLGFSEKSIFYAKKSISWDSNFWRSIKSIYILIISYFYLALNKKL